MWNYMMWFLIAKFEVSASLKVSSDMSEYYKLLVYQIPHLKETKII